MHPVPAYVSQQEFKEKVDALVDSLLALPVCERNFINFDILLPNNLLAADMKPSGTSGQPPPGVWFKFECETEDHLTEILRDEQVKKVIAGAKDFGFHDNASLFTADVTTRVDVVSPSPKARFHASFVAKIPKDISVDEFHAKLEAAVDSFVELPVCQNNILKHTYLRQNMNIADETRALDYPDAEQIVVLLHEHGTWDDLIKITQDAAYRKLMAEQVHKALPGTEMWGFSLDVVTKISTS
ncbi:hypothetical protein MSAN_00868000 [Mycena sanguinolenta]|uniref:Uncharacterized protein n=1 Tax=Mycena sanguinolenta TaxID=230812 RepID=A0A8H7DCN8_9AGAR|nr:hypothetical protein MSAN_00868000 [Mycena sanguinolenta]